MNMVYSASSFQLQGMRFQECSAIELLRNPQCLLLCLCMRSDVRIQGLNVYCVYANDDTVYNELIITHDHDVLPKDMMIQVNNRSTDLKWIYAPLFFGYPDDGKQFESGDEVTVSVVANSRLTLKQFGIQIVYVPARKGNE